MRPHRVRLTHSLGRELPPQSEDASASARGTQQGADRGISTAMVRSSTELFPHALARPSTAIVHALQSPVLPPVYSIYRVPHHLVVRGGRNTSLPWTLQKPPSDAESS